MNTDITSRRALVTGGSGGIGAAICERLAADGHQVIVHANRSLDKAKSLVEKIVAAGGRAEAVAFDITDRSATAAALEALVEVAPIQILVNNAGIHDDAVFPGMTGEQWDRVLDVSLNGFFNVTQPLTMPMMRTRWGRIVSVSSVAAVAGNARAGELRRCQRRTARGQQIAGAGAGQPRRHGQRGGARADRHRDDRRQLRRRCGQTSGADAAGRSAGRGGSTWWLSWPRTKRATFPAR